MYVTVGSVLRVERTVVLTASAPSSCSSGVCSYNNWCRPNKPIASSQSSVISPLSFSYFSSQYFVSPAVVLLLYHNLEPPHTTRENLSTSKTHNRPKYSTWCLKGDVIYIFHLSLSRCLTLFQTVVEQKVMLY